MSQPKPADNTIESLLEVLKNVPRINDLEYELKKYKALKQWAYDHIGIDYRDGDRVEIVEDINCENSGWYPYRECLTKGRTGVVTNIELSPHTGAWYCHYTPDEEWSASAPDVDGKVTRHWHGPVDQIRPGFIRPSEWEQETYPEGRKHIFVMKVEHLRKVQV